MGLCFNCNSPVDENAKICPLCGATLSGNTNEASSEIKQNIEDANSEYDSKKDVEKNKGIAILSYLSFLCLIPLLGAKDSKFAYFHAVQGTVLFVMEVILSVALALVYTIFAIVMPLFIAYRVYRIFRVLLLGIFIAFSVLGIINVVNGEIKRLPIIGNVIKVKK